ncbi:DUF192 domain-containing protein [Spirochaetia bacterium 38H-sp]|uniref:DUF192 domain-containing protein n=1 Tax=Rarispira pelagica TaxID=3141764 RepID=A0ABU9UBE1_9SPIR
MRFLKSFSLSVFLLFIVSCLQEDGLAVIDMGKVKIKAEVADTLEERRHGLMGRTELAENRGMLFVFPEVTQPAFWMKDTIIPLSLAFIDNNGVIREIYELEPLSIEPVRSNYPVLYALEVNRGFFKKHGIKPGDKIIIKM